MSKSSNSKSVTMRGGVNISQIPKQLKKPPREIDTTPDIPQPPPSTEPKEPTE